MANVSRKKGFLPYGEVLRERPYVAGGTVYAGDLVKMNSSGLVVVCAAGDAALGVACAKATSGNPVMVWDHPDQQYVCQATTGVSIAQTHAGNNADILATAGSSTYNMSRQELDASTLATTSTLVLRVLGIAPAINNAAGDVAKVIVAINVSQLKAGADGV
jgi:hypothetical protein